MSDAKPNRVYLDPRDVDEAMQQLSRVYDLDAETLKMLRRIVELYPRPVWLCVDEASALFDDPISLVDRFTFNIQTDELVLFSRDPMTFVDAMIEQAMYMAGFATMLGMDDTWKIEFTIGAWKPVKNRIKRLLGIPILDEPLWVVGMPPEPDETLQEDPYPFRTLVSQLDIASFTQMVLLAARDDVEVNFPGGADPRVIQVYIRMKTAMYQVAEGLGLDDWREFNHRLLLMVAELEEEYQPHKLPAPVWWKRLDGGADQEEELPSVSGRGADLAARSLDSALDRFAADDRFTGEEAEWNPFEAYIEQLFEDDLPAPDEEAPDDGWDFT